MMPRDVTGRVLGASEAFFHEAELIQWTLLETALARNGSLPARPSWEPPVNIMETSDGLWVVAALPGVAEGDIQARLEKRLLVLSGCRKPGRDWVKGRLHVVEVPCGRFERRLRLPQGRKYELAEAGLFRGLFSVKLRRLPCSRTLR